MSYIGSFISAASKAYRTVKIAVWGPGDIKSAPEATSFGDDSVALPGMKAVFVNTAHIGQPVIVGYYNGALKALPLKFYALPGEKRIYATDTDGTEAARIWIHGSGVIDIGGTGAGSNPNHAAQYEGLASAFNEFKADFNAHITNYNAHVHAVPPYTPLLGPPPTPTTPTATPGTPTAADISPAKLTKIKTE